MIDIVYLPASHALDASLSVLACGAYSKNRACLLQNQQVQWSAINGEMSDARSCLALHRSLGNWCSNSNVTLGALAHDMHPDFYSTHLAVSTAMDLGISSIAVQHHHAHVASVIAAKGIQHPVIGVVLDGMGLGTNDELWGGELLFVAGGSDAHRWKRLSHLSSLALPGGDVAAREPWRLAAAVLHQCTSGERMVERFAPISGIQSSRIVCSMLENRLNCPRSSSTGRWFDAAAGALGVSVRQTHEAEAAIALERYASHWLQKYPNFDWPYESINLYPVVKQLFDFRPVAHGAAIFHMALVNGVANAAIAEATEKKCKDIVLAGGCFANRILYTRLSRILQTAGFHVHALAADDCGDDSLALGQAWVAACQLLADSTDRETHVQLDSQDSTSQVLEYC